MSCKAPRGSFLVLLDAGPFEQLTNAVSHSILFSSKSTPPMVMKFCGKTRIYVILNYVKFQEDWLNTLPAIYHLVATKMIEINCFDRFQNNRNILIENWRKIPMAG